MILNNLSRVQICKSLEVIPNQIYDKEGSCLKSYQKVAQLVLDFLSTVEESILKMESNDQAEIKKSLESLKEDQLLVHNLIKACLLANVSIQEYIEYRFRDQLDPKALMKVHKAQILLGQKPAPYIPKLTISEEIVTELQTRLASDEFKQAVEPLDDITGTIRVFQIKVDRVIDMLATKIFRKSMEELPKVTKAEPSFWRRFCTIL